MSSIFTFLGITFFLLGFLSWYHWLLEVFANFRVYFLFYFFGMIFISLWNKNKWAIVANASLVALILLSIRPYLKVNTIENDAQVLKLISVNLLSSNTNYQDVIDFVIEENPDFIYFMEVTPIWIEGLESLERSYPYHYAIPRLDNFGISIYSKYELSELKVVGEPINQIPSYVTDILYNDKTFHFIGTHPLPPICFEYFTLRNNQLGRINQMVKEYDNNLILMGDMNCSSFSANFDRLTNGTNLKDSRIGFGLQGTWSAKNKVFSFAIDHCLVSDNIQVIERRIGREIGSDHYPIIVEVR